MSFGKHLVTGVSFAALAASGVAVAQDSEMRQATVTVTGSAIAGTPEDAALPVDVLTAGDLRLEGSPTISELIRNLGPSSGTDSETNQFGSNGLEGSSNINLRGLGPARTLVLINGKRQTFHPYAVGEQAQLFVNTNLIPAAAIGRIEVLKDGAAAIYGSDAIAGVVNFITRDDLDGLEVGGSFQTFEGSDGDYTLSAAYGFQGDDWNWVTSVGYRERSETLLSEKDWAVRPFADNVYGGWSSFGNPGSFVNGVNAFVDANVNEVSGLSAAVVDPACAELGGIPGTDRCRFQFTAFDNLVEEETHLQIFSEYNRDINGMDLHLEALYAYTDVPSANTSPSFPPQVFTTQSIPANSEPLQAFLAANPDFETALYTASPNAPLDPATDPILFFGRPFGLGGFPGTGFAQETSREYSGLRLAGSLAGEFESGINWDVALSYSQNEGERATPDTFKEGFTAALNGYGVCVDPITGLDPATGTSPLDMSYGGTLMAGEGTCEWYNPFSSALEVSAFGDVNTTTYDATQENSAALVDWLTGSSGTEVTTDLLVFDGVVSGQTNAQAGGGAVGFAAGFQVRREGYEVVPFDVTNLELTPGPGGDGPFGFLSGTNAVDEEQTIIAVFGELQIPLFDNLDLQVAARYEQYEDEIGSTFDPKVAAKWQVNDVLALRGSAQTSFRGPTLNQLGGQATSLQFVTPTGAFKAVDTFGNPDLDPESAFSFNVGALFNMGGFEASIDYYNFDFEDPIIVEAQSEIVDAVEAALATMDTSDDDIISRVDFDGAMDVANIARIRTNIVNGPDIETSGIDVRVANTWDDVMGAELTVGADASYVIEYVVGDFEIQGATITGSDRAGQFNRSNFTRSLPQTKANVFANVTLGDHNLRGVVRYIDDYADERQLPFVDGDTIDSQTTFDAFYNWTAPWDFDLGLSVVNITDEDPPFAAFDLNYDPYTHNPLGRTFKVTFTKRFAGLGG